jgi:phosphatidylserine decarboxylase
VRLDSAALPFVGGALVLALLSGMTGFAPLAALFVVLGGFFLFFFRDPERRVPDGDHLVVSPADGRVLVAGPALADSAPPGAWQQISVFLSPMDVHVNRIPASGRITQVSFKPGRFLPAYRHDAGSANERSEIWIEHCGQAIVARQIVGMLARRVVCRVKSGADVRAGERFGIMKFGSRMDVFVPPDARLAVAVGEVVRGGETVIAMLHCDQGAPTRPPAG